MTNDIFGLSGSDDLSCASVYNNDDEMKKKVEE
jgi:hypothetical protein